MSSNPRLDAAYATQARAIRARVQAFTAARFGAGQYRDADLARFVSQVSSVVLAGRAQTAALTDSYLTQVLRSSGITVPPHAPVDTAALRGVAVDEVYGRPYTTVWTKLGEGAAFDAAVSAGEARLADLVSTDMQLARTHTAQSIFSRTDGVHGYARVPSGPATCALCEVASTQVYHTEELMPIHPGCNCGVDPITDSNPWDQRAADQTLEDTHASVQEQLGMSDPGARSPDYRKVVVVNEHGEIGPVLGRAQDHFTGPSGLK